MPKNKFKKRKTYDLRLTKFELLHMRDLFSVLLPPDTKKTVSQALAEHEDRAIVEALLWDKLHKVCISAGLPTGEECPDYMVVPTAAPPMSVFQVSSEPAQSESEGLTLDSDEEEE